MEENIVNSVNAESVVNVEPQETTSIESTESVNTEVASVQPEEKKVQSPEENAQYAKIRKEAEQRGRDLAIAELGYEWNGKPITTEAQYKQALKEQEETQKRQELIDKGYDPDVITKLVENLPEVQWAREHMSKAQKEEAQRQDQIVFLEWFKDKNGREFDANKDTIAPEVWQEHESGKSLKDAYISNQYVKSLESELSELRKAQEIEKTNQNNAESSTGSVKGLGSVGNEFISKDVFEANKHDQRWMIKNLSKIVKSRAEW